MSLGHAITLVQFATFLLSMGVSVAIMLHWGHEKLRWLGFLACASSIYAFGYLMEITAVDFDSAWLANMTTYIASPFLGLFLWLFVRDFLGRKPLPLWLLIVLFAAGTFFTVNVWLYPFDRLYYTSAAFNAKGVLPGLSTSPSVLYYPCTIFNFVFAIWGGASLVHEFGRHQQYRRAAIAIILLLAPISGQILKLVLPHHSWNPTSTVLTLAVAVAVSLLTWLAAKQVPLWQEVKDKTLFMAEHDGLTGVFNHSAFLSAAEAAYRYERSREVIRGCALMVDTDNFKDINDKYGHQAGDVVLHELAASIAQALRRTDILGRYGGDEFGIWLPTACETDAVKVGEHIRDLIATKVFTNNQQKVFRVTVSIGVADCTKTNPARFDDLMLQADVGLYKAKQAGRDCIACFEQGDTMPAGA
ncbi:MAG: diguanylate cyclase [Coriobacteriales bacterium]|jgi:diguanylate cyclase (GGDEF)-like protein|nr:diguanylate cyclase [Coriobacteriales bacterium]